jgi:hypothetical protein
MVQHYRHSNKSFILDEILAGSRCGRFGIRNIRRCGFLETARGFSKKKMGDRSPVPGSLPADLPFVDISIHIHLSSQVTMSVNAHPSLCTRFFAMIK